MHMWPQVYSTQSTAERQIRHLVNLKSQQEDPIQLILGAILHLGNLEVKKFPYYYLTSQFECLKSSVTNIYTEQICQRLDNAC